MIERYLNEELIVIDPKITSKKELFSYVSIYLKERDYVNNESLFLQSLIEREELLNTEIYPGVAIPHTDCASVKKVFLLIIICKVGLDYEHPSFGPVNVMFLFGCKEKFDKDYLRLVARSARLLKNSMFVDALMNSSTPLDVLKTIYKYDCYSDDLESDKSALMIIRLYKPEKLADLLTALVEVGINNASIVRASSMSKLISYQMPIFAGLNLRSSKKNTEAIIVFCAFFDKKKPSQLTSVLRDFQIDIYKPGNGYIQVISTKKIFGEMNEFL